MKRKFKILGQVAEYSIDTQIHIVLGLTGLYNFICLYEDIEDEYKEFNIDIVEDNGSKEPIREQVASKMDQRRDKLAKDMWEAYCNYIERDI
jgi:hypothetical protein